MKTLTSSTTLILILLGLLSTAPLAGQVSPPQEIGGERQVSAKVRTAAAHQEIILTLIEQGSYSEVPAEFQNILDLGFVGSQERLVVKAAWSVAEMLKGRGQFDLAHDVVHRTLNTILECEGRYHMLMMNGKIFYDQELFQRAIEAYRQAQELSKLPGCNGLKNF